HVAAVASAAVRGGAAGRSRAGSGGEGAGRRWISVASGAPVGAVIAASLPTCCGVGAGTRGGHTRSAHPGTSSGNAKILATTYFPERLPSQYLRRWRA